MSDVKRAIVTGATSGIGEECCRYLLSEGYEVIGIGRDFKRSNIEDEKFHRKVLDLSKVERIEEEISPLCKEREVDLLINCAGVGSYGSHDSISSKDLIEMINVNFTASAILSRCLIPSLRKSKGAIIFVSSVASLSPSRLGACYGATKAAINHLSRSIFEEVRKADIKVSNLILDMTKTHFHDDSWFGPSSAAGAALSVSDVSNSLDFILKQPQTIDIGEIIIRAQYNEIEKRKLD